MDIRQLVEKAFQRDLSDASALRDAFECLRLLEKEGDFSLAHDRNKQLRDLAGSYAIQQNSSRMYDTYKDSLLFDAPFELDAFCLYIELDRPSDKRFYAPRRKQLYKVARELQRLTDDELDLLAISMPPGTGKSTLAIFYLCQLAGRYPTDPILGGSHSNSFLRGVYDECLRIMGPGSEYLWQDVFPDMKIIRTNAQDMMIDIGRDRKDGKRFSTLEFSSIGSGNAGKVRAQRLLYCDDLVDGIEAAVSRDRMDKLWQQYTTDLRQRKIGNCKELHIATRWSVHDVIGRLGATYENDPRAKFIVMPALNEEDESNFDYGNTAGFTTAFYRSQREIMEDAEWRALYMNEPIEREGQLYNEKELRRYFELPEGEPDAILSVCDTKDRGKDYCAMPIAYQYGNDYYIEAIVCDNSNPEVVETRLVSALLAHNVHMSRFESNSAGGKIAEKVQKEVKERGGRTRITTKYTTANKETKIIINAAWVKDHCLFKDDSVIKEDKEYRRALKFLTGYTMAGKNKNDDIPDAFAQFAIFAQDLQGATIQVLPRLF